MSGDTSTGADHKARVSAAVRELGVSPRSVRYPTVYGGSKEAVEFTFHDETDLVIAVWQAVGGTVDEKFPFLFENATANERYAEVHIVLGGDGFRLGAWKWLEDSVNDWNEAGKHPHMNLFRSSDDFRSYCQRLAH
jgi:hypothetical protein